MGQPHIRRTRHYSLVLMSVVCPASCALDERQVSTSAVRASMPDSSLEQTPADGPEPTLADSGSQPSLADASSIPQPGRETHATSEAPCVDAGACGLTVPPCENGLLTKCDETCFDLSSDRNRCGACDRPCLGGQCTEGICALDQLAAGGAHTCVALPNVGVRCWGFNRYGQLGYGHTEQIGDNETPAAAGVVDLGRTAIQLAAGTDHTCALFSTGDVGCWGANFSGALGYGNANHIGDDEAPIFIDPVDAGGTVAQVVAGNYFACVLHEDGSVRCWGSNFAGQLGYGHTNTIGDDEHPASAAPVDVGGSVVQLAAGDRHACALLSTGEARCWGDNASGQLGYGHMRIVGDNESPSSAGSVNVGGPVVALTAGGDHTCALLSSGDVSCWGRNDSGQLGYGHTNNIGDDELPTSTEPVNVGAPVARVVAGGQHTCALLSTGAVRCWGANFSGELGLGHTNMIGDDETPLSAGTVSLGGSVTHLAAGGGHNCARLSNGDVRCWGTGGSAALGYGNTDNIGDDELPSSVAPVVLR